MITAQSPKGCITRIQIPGSTETTHSLYRRIFSTNMNMSRSVSVGMRVVIRVDAISTTTLTTYQSLHFMFFFVFLSMNKHYLREMELAWQWMLSQSQSCSAHLKMKLCHIITYFYREFLMSFPVEKCSHISGWTWLWFGFDMIRSS